MEFSKNITNSEELWEKSKNFLQMRAISWKKAKILLIGQISLKL